MKIAIIIPDRNDRPQFLQNCLRMIGMQIKQPSQIILVNHPPISPEFDLLERIKKGYEQVSNYIDVVAIIENDDWYSKHYLKFMADNYHSFGCPDIFGVDYTYYYHLRSNGVTKLLHKNRASLFNTLIKPGLNIKWNEIKNPFVDIFLWRQLKGITLSPERPLSIGIKHGIGLCGGRAHRSNFIYQETNSNFLRQYLDSQSLKFYENIYCNRSVATT